MNALTVNDYTDLITLDLLDGDITSARGHWEEMRSHYPEDAQHVAEIVRNADLRRLGLA